MRPWSSRDRQIAGSAPDQEVSGVGSGATTPEAIAGGKNRNAAPPGPRLMPPLPRRKRPYRLIRYSVNHTNPKGCQRRNRPGHRAPEPRLRVRALRSVPAYRVFDVRPSRCRPSWAANRNPRPEFKAASLTRVVRFGARDRSGLRIHFIGSVGGQSMKMFPVVSSPRWAHAGDPSHGHGQF